MMPSRTAWLGGFRRHIAQMAPHHKERDGGRLLIEALQEIERLRGIIARNALQRLLGEDATELCITADDIKDSLEVLYEWQATPPPNDLQPALGAGGGPRREDRVMRVAGEAGGGGGDLERPVPAGQLPHFRKEGVPA